MEETETPPPARPSGAPPAPPREAAPGAAPSPVTPKPSVLQQSNKALAEIKAGDDPLRPFRRAYTFVRGTISGTLNGISNWGRKGFWVGAGVGVLAAIALQGLAPFFACAAVGLMGSALVGGTVGLFTGGTKAVNRQIRGEIYADDLIVRGRQQQNAGRSNADYSNAFRKEQQRRADNVNAYFLLQRQNEAERDANAGSNTSYANSASSTTWQDRVQASATADRGIA